MVKHGRYDKAGKHEVAAKQLMHQIEPSAKESMHQIEPSAKESMHRIEPCCIENTPAFKKTLKNYTMQSALIIKRPRVA
jgi:hypothetical protein